MPAASEILTPLFDRPGLLLAAFVILVILAFRVRKLKIWAIEASFGGEAIRPAATTNTAADNRPKAEPRARD
jgi:hypothetical protein